MSHQKPETGAKLLKGCYRHFIWDFDGMLFSSYAHTTEALMRVFREEGIKADSNEVNARLRVHLRRAIEYYGITEEMRKRFYIYEGELEHPPLTLPYEGIPELLRDIFFAGGKNYLYTNRDKLALTYLQKFALYEYFEGFVTRENGFPLKPDSGGVKWLISEYSLKPSQCLMLGDRELDIEAGLGGGIEGCLFDEYKTSPATKAKYAVQSIGELTSLLIDG